MTTDILSTLPTGPTWCVDTIERQPTELALRGWILGVEPEDVAVVVDGKLAEVTSGLPRPDIERLCRHVPGAARSGFAATVPLKPASATSPAIRLSLGRQSTREPVAADLDYWYPLQIDGELPPPEQRRRVHGSESESSFLLEGCTTAAKLRAAVIRVTGRPLSSFDRLLDWGCGCGRVTRWLAGGPRITGIDIDAGNVAWCAEHLDGTFLAVDPLPPTPLKGGSFELVVGVSVLTHLRIQDQLAWLAELHRITRPGGVLCLTVHGGVAAARAGLPPELLAQWGRDGFLDVGRNLDLDGVLADAEYYRNVFHTEAYVRDVWAQWFDVEAIVPGYIGNHQDLVVLRRPSRRPRWRSKPRR
jgi:SAM-dependent methyltransferase